MDIANVPNFDNMPAFPSARFLGFLCRVHGLSSTVEKVVYSIFSEGLLQHNFTNNTKTWNNINLIKPKVTGNC